MSATATVEKTDKTSKAPRASFVTVVDRKFLNDKNALTSSDVVAMNYDSSKFEPLTRAEFASDTLWAEYRISKLRQAANEKLALADRLERELKSGLSIADPAKRATLKKVMKLANAAKAAIEAAKAAGIDMSDFEKSMTL
jgi:hypothetical protein